MLNKSLDLEKETLHFKLTFPFSQIFPESSFQLYFTLSNMLANFTANQLTAFFHNGPQMNLSPTERSRFQEQGLTTVDDFAHFKELQLDEALKNMRVNIPGIPAVTAADGTILTPAVPAKPPCLVPATSIHRIRVATIAYHYYQSIKRTPTPANMNFGSVLTDFYTEYEAIQKLEKEDKPDVPVLHKNTTPLKWVDSFKDCLSRTYGLRHTPLSYVIRDVVDPVPEEDDPLEPSKSYGSSGSVVDELVLRLDHDDPLYKTDNKTVYLMLEEATRSSSCASAVKPYTKRKDGRAAFLSLVASHAGKDKWEKLVKDRTRFLMNTKWNGRTYSLDKFINLHRTSYVQLVEASQYVDFQLPSEHTRVTYLLDSITNNDADIRAALGSIRINTDNMRNDFEQAATCLLPVDPYNKHKEKSNKPLQVTDVTLKNKSASKTGVDLRWHTPDEYRKLSKDQRAELYEWQRSKEGRDVTAKQKKASGIPVKQSAKKRLRAKVSALEAQLAETPTLEELQSCIASVNQQNESKPILKPSKPKVTIQEPPSGIDSTYKAYAMAVQKILKRKRGEDGN